MTRVFVVAPAPPAGHAGVIAFWDMHRGLLSRGRAVSLTTDGGRTFRVVLRASTPVTGIQAFGRSGAVVDFRRPLSLRTLDGGRTWHPFTHRFDADFATPRIGLGFRVGRFEFVRGLVLTTDGGRSWQRRESPCARYVSFSAAIELVTPRLGWIVCVGQPGTGQQLKAVYRTTNAAKTWRRATGDLTSSGYAWGAGFAPDGFGLVWEGRGTLYVTRDGGGHWTAKPRLAEPEVDFGGGGAAFAGGRGLVLLTRGDRSERLLATRDHGRRWSLVRRWG
jgi:photosystem II stability/assembly factor-like uncharacterized protein